MINQILPLHFKSFILDFLKNVIPTYDIKEQNGINIDIAIAVPLLAISP